MNTALVKTFVYDAHPDRVWQALTDPRRMAQWYFPQLQAFEPVVGYRFRFDDAGQTYRKEWIVTQVVPGRILAHSWRYAGFPGSSEVVFELIAEGEGTGLRVTQTGLETFPDHPHFARERFGQGWDDLLGRNLRSLLSQDDK